MGWKVEVCCVMQWILVESQPGGGWVGGRSPGWVEIDNAENSIGINQSGIVETIQSTVEISALLYSTLVL